MVKITQFENKFENKSVLITGATGFVGRNLLATLLKTAPYKNGSLKITCTTRNPKTINEQWPSEIKKLKVLDWDIRLPLEKSHDHYDFVFHLAGENRSSQNAQQAKIIYETSVEGTKNLLNAIKSKKIRSQKIIFASSGAVYGPTPFKNNHFIEPESIPDRDIADLDPYRASKAEAEVICKKFLQESDSILVIARMFAFVGPHLPLDKNFAIGNFFKDCLLRREITVNSHGSSVRSYQSATDMVNWLIAILMNGENGNIYNVGSSEEISIKSLAQLICEIFQNTCGLKILGDQTRDPVSSYYVPNITKAKEKFGLENSIDLKSSISLMRNHLLATSPSSHSSSHPTSL